LLLWPLASWAAQGGPNLNTIFNHGESPAFKNHQAKVQAAFQQFPLFQPKVDEQGQPAFQLLSLKNPLVIGNTNTYGFRIQVPQRKNQEDFVWAFVQPANNFYWDILPQADYMRGFLNFNPRPLTDFNNLGGLRPINAKKLIIQTLAGTELKDDQSYVIWFTFGPQHPNFISLKFTFASLGPQKINQVDALEKALALSSKTPSKPAPSGPKHDDPYASGSGFFVTNDGYLVTCFHVVQGAATVKVKIGDKMQEAEVVKTDSVNDLAILKVTTSSRALPIAPSSGVKLGDSVFTIGFPDIELQGVSPKLTKGDISGLAGIQDDPRTFQISVAVQPGNSGGPLVDNFGNVVGVIVAKLSAMAVFETTGDLPEDVNYATKSSALQTLLASVPDLSAKLKRPTYLKGSSFGDVVQQAEESSALILVY